MTILPCPFCGRTPEYDDPASFTQGPQPKWGSVVCCITGPEVRTGFAHEFQVWRDAAITEWNKRSPNYEWRPIEEIHEDWGPCVLMDINDPGYQEIGSSLGTGFEMDRWTHFAEVPKLSAKRALELIAAMQTAGEGAK